MRRDAGPPVRAVRQLTARICREAHTHHVRRLRTHSVADYVRLLDCWNIILEVTYMMYIYIR
jgi:hypothetical protein